jgi:hypothetical protein
MADRDPHDVVRLTTATNPAQAHIIAQALRDEDIQSKVVGDFLDASFGDLPGTRPEVWVHREDLAAAEEVLRRSRRAAGTEAPDETTP